MSNRERYNKYIIKDLMNRTITNYITEDGYYVLTLPFGTVHTTKYSYMKRSPIDFDRHITNVYGIYSQGHQERLWKTYMRRLTMRYE